MFEPKRQTFRRGDKIVSESHPELGVGEVMTGGGGPDGSLMIEVAWENPPNEQPCELVNTGDPDIRKIEDEGA